MAQLLEDSPHVLVPVPGEILEGAVIFKGRNKILVDVGGVATGIVSGRELKDSFNTFGTLHVGDCVVAMVLEEENEEGLVVLSLRRASQKKAWQRFHDLIAADSSMLFIAQEINKGGLLANIDGIRAFLPVSQLAPMHYPRVNNADPNEIMSRLQKFIGHSFTVKIITMDEEAGKIVVSEREAMSEERAKALESLHIGDMRDGVISGIVKFGLFVAFDGLEGLVHISEIAWGHVKNPVEYGNMNDRVKVKVIGVEGEKLSLSMKQLTKDPWEEIAERYPVGKRVAGTVTRLTEYGAFVKLEKDINGLVHLTEMSHYRIKDPSEVLTIGQKVEAQVINIDVDERRIGLSIKALLPIDKATLERIKAEREEEERRRQEEEATRGKVEQGAKEAKETVEVKEPVGREDAKKIEVEEKEKKEKKEEKEEKEDAAEVIPATKTELSSSEAERANDGSSREAESRSAPEKPPKTKFIASKTGKKYYPSDSAAAKKIKEENRVTFATEEEAKKAGYTA